MRKNLVLLAIATMMSLSTTAQSLAGHTEMGFTFGSKDGERIELLGDAGAQLNNILYVGAGLGVNYYTTAERWTLPLFANVRVNLPISSSSIQPYLDFKPGYGLSLEDVIDGGFYFSGTAGVEFSDFTVGVGYATQSLGVNAGALGKFNVKSSGITVKVGYSF